MDLVYEDSGDDSPAGWPASQMAAQIKREAKAASLVFHCIFVSQRGTRPHPNAPPYEEERGYFSRDLFSGEQTHDLWGELAGHLLDFRDGAGCQGAGQHHDADAGHSQGRGPGKGSPGEGAGYDANGRHALGFGHHCVVETPRRAGASICDGVNHHVAVIGQRLNRLIGARSAIGEFGGIDDLGRAVIIEQHLF